MLPKEVTIVRAKSVVEKAICDAYDEGRYKALNDVVNNAITYSRCIGGCDLCNSLDYDSCDDSRKDLVISIDDLRTIVSQLRNENVSQH